MLASFAQEIFNKLQSASEVIAVFHRNPDPDSLGAGAAMAIFLRKYKIPCRFYCVTALPPEAHFFGVTKDNCLNKQQVVDLILAQKFPSPSNKKLIICTLDAGDLQHAGLEEIPRFASLPRDDQKWQCPFLINFDHHATNTRFGNINIVDAACSSTTEVLYNFFQALKYSIDAQVAAYLLAGILVDTDYFSNPATTADALKVAGGLIARGAHFIQLRKLLFERRNIKMLQLIGEVLARLQKNKNYNVAITYLTQKDALEHGLDIEDVQDMANVLNVVGDAKAMIVLKEINGIIKVSMRTTRQDIDLGRLAMLFNGGGHRKAAGFRISGRLVLTDHGLQVQ